MLHLERERIEEMIEELDQSSVDFFANVNRNHTGGHEDSSISLSKLQSPFDRRGGSPKSENRKAKEDDEENRRPSKEGLGSLNTEKLLGDEGSNTEISAFTVEENRRKSQIPSRRTKKDGQKYDLLKEEEHFECDLAQKSKSFAHKS